MSMVMFVFALILMNLYGTLPLYNNGKDRTDGYVAYTYGAFNVHNNFSNFAFSFATLLRVATLDNWTWLMHDIVEAGHPEASFIFIIFIIVAALLFLNLFTAIVMDQYEFTSRVTSPPLPNGTERQIITFSQASSIAEEWSWVDPHMQSYCDMDKIQKLLSRLEAPIGFGKNCPKHLQLRHLRKMELRMSERRRVHYVDFFISCIILRYKQQKKPMSDLNLAGVDGNIAISIQTAFPTISDAEVFSTAGLMSANYAITFLQSQYRGLQLRRLRSAGDVEAIQNYSARIADAMLRQEAERKKKDEEDNKAAAASKKGKKGKKSRKSKKDG